MTDDSLEELSQAREPRQQRDSLKPPEADLPNFSDYATGRQSQLDTSTLTKHVTQMVDVSITLTHIHTHTHSHAQYTHTHTRTCTHAHTHTHTRTCTHAHTHTHTQSLIPRLYLSCDKPIYLCPVLG